MVDIPLVSQDFMPGYYLPGCSVEILHDDVDVHHLVLAEVEHDELSRVSMGSV